MFNISIAQISMYSIWSNVLYNSTENKHDSNHYFTIVVQQIKLNVGFWWEGKTGEPGEKLLGAE